MCNVYPKGMSSFLRSLTDFFFQNSSCMTKPLQNSLTLLENQIIRIFARAGEDIGIFCKNPTELSHLYRRILYLTQTLAAIYLPDCQTGFELPG